ncbi:MAG: nucleotidyltransferase domain-containing protein [Acidobacteria bacterium]|nr:MAG: nucleotidyltransferase domain-containing protein [Acidobacteriota bacterium]
MPRSTVQSVLSPEHIAAAVRSVAAADRRILALYLFGSYARGEASPASDVDLGVLFVTPQPLTEVVDLESRLEGALGRRVDLVDAGRASAFLALDVVKGERLYCADEERCDEFDLYVLRRAADLAPFERARRRMLLAVADRPSRPGS